MENMKKKVFFWKCNRNILCYLYSNRISFFIYFFKFYEKQNCDTEKKIVTRAVY